MRAVDSYTDGEFRQTILRALRLLTIGTLAAAPFVWWKAGWASALLLLLGSCISGSGLWEWLRLMTAMMVSMDGGGKPGAVGWVLTGFFLRLVVVIGVLYGSLNLLEGSVVALAAGLGLGVFCLMIEGLRLVKAWTV